MDGALAEEARRLLQAARATLLELAEEGIELDPLARPAQAAAAVPAAPAPVATTAAAARVPAPREAQPPQPAPAPQQSAAPPAGIEWGERPSLDFVRDQLGECTRCGLAQGRNSIVFGSGNPDAKLMFIGEGPGAQEDQQGQPFVGRAGELLTQMIEKGLGIQRSDVYICNIVKCRPPDNRNPLPDEVAACSPFMDGQIRAVQPKVIVSLGKPAASLLLGRDVAITRMRGTWQSYRGIPLMPTLHPAFVLRQYTPENRRMVWEDLKAAKQRSEE